MGYRRLSLARQLQCAQYPPLNHYIFVLPSYRGFAFNQKYYSNLVCLIILAIFLSPFSQNLTLRLVFNTLMVVLA